MSIEERLERLEKIVNLILDQMNMRKEDGEVKNPSEHFKPYMRDDK
jgi:hypothetical protein